MGKYLLGFLLVVVTFLGCKNQKIAKTNETTITPQDTNYIYPLSEVTSNLAITRKDSLDLLEYWRAVIKEYMPDDTLTNLSDKEIVNLFRVNNQGTLMINSGKVFYAPDRKFKVITIDGEGCGAYCNPFWHSKIITKTGFKSKEIEVCDVQNIHLLPDGKYLILDNSGSRPASVYTIATNSATVIGFEKDSVRRYPFEYTYPQYDEYKDNLTLSFSQEHFLFTDQYLKYDPATQKLSYQYANNFSYCCDIDSSYLYKGEFQYENGRFRQLFEKKENYVEPEQK